MNTDIWVEIVRVSPSLLWFALIMVVVILIFPIVRDDILPRINSIKLGDLVITLSEALKRRHQPIVASFVNCVSRRAVRLSSALNGSRLLWVDDNLSHNEEEQRFLKLAGVAIDVALDTESAIYHLRSNSYDVIISDICRDCDTIAGITFAEEMSKIREYSRKKILIYYVGKIDIDKSLPQNTFAITNRADELFHYTMDVIERQRG